MTVQAISQQDAIDATYNSLGIVARTTDDENHTALLAQSLRRAIVFLAPCSFAVLCRAVSDSLAHLLNQPDNIVRQNVEAILNELCAAGDILELYKSDAQSSLDQTLLWAAPASYVPIDHTHVLLLGSDGDSITHVPSELLSKVEYTGALRFLRSSSTSDLLSKLQDFELYQIEADNWIRRPQDIGANSFLEPLKAKLTQSSDHSEDIQVLSGRSQYYQSRWQAAQHAEDGIYIARRPQQFGSDKWCLIKNAAGRITNLLDVIPTHNRERHCDRAWHIHHALSASQSQHEVYTLQWEGRIVSVSFSFPIPSWCERFILVHGIRAEAENCLMSFVLNEGSWEVVRNLLENGLWMRQQEH